MNNLSSYIKNTCWVSDNAGSYSDIAKKYITERNQCFVVQTSMSFAFVSISSLRLFNIRDRSNRTPQYCGWINMLKKYMINDGFVAATAAVAAAAATTAVATDAAAAAAAAAADDDNDDDSKNYDGDGNDDSDNYCGSEYEKDDDLN